MQDIELIAQKKSPRIAIIGGGIAGVTAAQAIANRSNEIQAKIVVFEGDSEGGHRDVNFGAQEQPAWVAGKFTLLILQFFIHHAFVEQFAYRSITLTTYY